MEGWRVMDWGEVGGRDREEDDERSGAGAFRESSRWGINGGSWSKVAAVAREGFKEGKKIMGGEKCEGWRWMKLSIVKFKMHRRETQSLKSRPTAFYVRVHFLDIGASTRGCKNFFYLKGVMDMEILEIDLSG
jgi:hypothetical protein